MKKKIGELRNIPIVEGDKNLVRKGTEIHINDLQSKGGSGGGSSRIEYWGISDKFNINANFEEDVASFALNMYINILAGYIKGIDLFDSIAIVSSGYLCNHFNNNDSNYFKTYKAFMFAPVFTKNEKYNNFNDVLKTASEEGVTIDDLVYPITEEEFYNLD